MHLGDGDLNVFMHRGGMVGRERNLLAIRERSEVVAQRNIGLGP